MGVVRLGGVDYAGYPFLLTGIATVTGLLLWLVVTRTRFGKVLISVITDREVSSALGVNVPRIYTLAFTLGAVLAALGGAFTAPMFSLVPGIGAEVIVVSFAVVAIGGAGAVGGAAPRGPPGGAGPRAPGAPLPPPRPLCPLFILGTGGVLLPPRRLCL